jgi:hypothetical protein
MKLTTITDIGLLGTGILLICLGFYFRRSSAKMNWKLFVTCSIAMALFGLLSLLGFIEVS